jgi:SAM-dependent methyltransferase
MMLREFLARSLPPRVVRQLRQLAWLRHDLWYALTNRGCGVLPPASLRFRVHGSVDIASFCAVGQQCCEDLLSLLGSLGKSLGDFRAILDFGCGCGRTMRFVQQHARPDALYGADQDAEMIRWCQRHLAPATFVAGSPEPPLPFREGMFDFVYAISVFSHLDAALGLRWLEELYRVCAPGAIAILTVHGPSLAPAMGVTGAAAEQYADAGFLFTQSGLWDGFMPDFYQTAFHRRDYVEAAWTRQFEFVAYHERAMNGHQDAVVLRKPI